MNSVPLIDISAAYNGDRASKQKIAEEISLACRNIGFFSIKGHDIDREMIEAAYKHAADFFALDADVKESCRRGPNEERLCVHQHDGYSALLEESADAVMGREMPKNDYLERFSIGKWILDDNKPIPFPNNSLGVQLRPAMKAYYEACLKLTELLTELMAMAAGLPDDFFVDKIDKSLDYMRFQHYPAATGVDEYDNGLSSHTDGGLLTLLTGTSGGLEVKTKDGQWVNGATDDVAHFIVNIGDILMRWSNDEWVSTEHQVALSTQSRISLVFFKLVNEDALIGAFDKFCTPDRPRKYEPIVFSDFANAKAAALYREK